MSALDANLFVSQKINEIKDCFKSPDVKVMVVALNSAPNNSQDFIIGDADPSKVIECINNLAKV